jgi:hypothetical protein
MFARRPVRVGRPGLLETAARTAVVAGTAQAVSGRVARRQQERAVQEQLAPSYEQAPVPEPVPSAAPASPPAAELIDQLERLAVLKGQGILTDEEFAAQKARLLGG